MNSSHCLRARARASELLKKSQLLGFSLSEARKREARERHRCRSLSLRLLRFPTSPCILFSSFTCTLTQYTLSCFPNRIKLNTRKKKQGGNARPQRSSGVDVVFVVDDGSSDSTTDASPPPLCGLCPLLLLVRDGSSCRLGAPVAEAPQCRSARGLGRVGLLLLVQQQQQRRQPIRLWRPESAV